MPQDSFLEPHPPPTGSVRKWPAWWILSLGALAIGVIRLWPDFSHQQKNIFTAQTFIIAGFLLLIWVLLFSRLVWQIRLCILAGLLLILVISASSLRIRGVSGDLLPILEWRFAKIKVSKSDAPIRPEPTNLTANPSTPIFYAADYPQFLGPQRNGVLSGPALANSWSSASPKLLWKHAVGAAWSGIAVSEGLAVTQEQNGEQESVTCYQFETGQLRWRHDDPAHYNTTIAGEGPRSTPTIVHSRVYSMGATGILNCIDLASGRLIWSRNVVQENRGRVGDWGVSCSPLCWNSEVIVTIGSDQAHSLGAYQADSGSLVWINGDDEASYASPTIARIAGTEQIISFASHSVAGHDPHDGTVLWKYPWPAGHPHIANPIVHTNDQLLVSSGYGTGSELLRITHAQTNHWRAERIWKSNRLKSKFANLIDFHGYIYGLDDGIMVCLEANSGQLKWKEGRYGHGQLILVGDVLLVMAENGDVAPVRPVPERHMEIARFHALDGKTWNPPALAGQYLLVRNDREAACYILPLAK